MTKYDILIPYEDVTSDHSDLLLCFETLKRFAIDLRCVWLITTNGHLPKEVADFANVVPGDDVYSSCKDANLFRKTIIGIKAGCGRVSINEEIPIVWMSDDNAIIKPVNLAEHPRVYNARTVREFIYQGANKWQRRMSRTFQTLEGMGKKLHFNFDAHVPQAFKRSELLDACLKAPEGWDFCIHTWCCGYIWGADAIKGAVNQDDVKARFENKENGYKPKNMDKCVYVGWNNAGRENAHKFIKEMLS